MGDGFDTRSGKTECLYITSATAFDTYLGHFLTQGFEELFPNIRYYGVSCEAHGHQTGVARRSLNESASRQGRFTSKSYSDADESCVILNFCPRVV